MKFANATNLNRKSGVAQWRDLRFLFPSSLRNCGASPHPVVPATTPVAASYCGILGLTMAPEKRFILRLSVAR